MLFLFCTTDPSHVIGLYPRLLPPNFRNSLVYPSQLPQLNGTEFENSVIELSKYLTEVCKNVMSFIYKSCYDHVVFCFIVATTQGAEA